MIEKICEYAVRQRIIILIFAVILAGIGIYSAANLTIDAFPDVTNVQVQVFTEAPTLAAVEVEKLISFPIESVMNGIPGVTQVRSLSKNGLSIITVVFEDSTDIYFARQQVFERLKTAEGRLPPGLAEPSMGPISTGMGQIYQYVVEGPSGNIMDLRTVQDWDIKFLLRTVPGVTDVLSFGGVVKQYQVLVDPARLIAYHIHLRDVYDALARNNANAGGGFIEHGSEQYIVRGVGLARSREDLESIAIRSDGGTPIYVRNVAEVAVGPEVRQGAVSMNGKGEVVTGIVLQLKGENSRAVIGRVKQQVDRMNQSLPGGVKVKSYYDQSELVEKSVGTVRTALLEGAVLVVLVLTLFLGNIRSAVIVTITLPISVLSAFALMRWQGISANLMSLGGLAIGIGMMVDGSVVMVENIFRRLTEPDAADRSLADRVISAAREVARPVAFAIGIIVVVFLPLFTLQGIEGKMFTPMAYTITFAMLGSLLISLTLAPALCTFLLRNGQREWSNPLLRLMHRVYEPALAAVMRRRGLAVSLALVLLAGSLALAPRLGSEFLPELDEGSALIRATLLPSVSLSQSLSMAQKMEKALLGVPEVTDVVSRIGRAEIGGDPEDVNNIELYVMLRPRERWRSSNKEEIVDEMRRRLAELPGAAYSFSQPIATRVDELLSGVKAQVAVKLFGPDLETLGARAAEIQAVMAKVRGVADLQAEQTAGLAQLNISVNRTAIARYGISVDDVKDVIETAIGGKVASQVFEGDRRFDVAVRLPKELRENVARLRDLQVLSPGDEHIPLSQVAAISLQDGPALIQRENSQRRLVVQCNVQDRDLGGFVEEARRAIARQVKLPAGYYITWGGQFESQQRADARLAVVVPVTIFLIFLLLFINFGSLRNAGLIVLNLPFALIGGVWGLYLRGMHMSVSASVGFIALFGVAVLNGVVMVTCFNQLRSRGHTVREAVLTGVRLRLRPIIMTALVASLGLVPLMFSNGTGSEVQKPLATVVVGGLVTSTLLTLLLLPTLYAWFERDPVAAPEVGA